MSRVSIIIPAYNEEENIGATVKSLRGLEEAWEIIVVDDGSRDLTAERAREAGARVIRLPVNRGKGGAMEEGLKQASHPVIAFLDADLGETAAEIKKIISPVLSGEADLAVARWPGSRKKGGIGLAQGLARWGIKKLTGFHCHSPLSGQRALRKGLIPELEGGFGVEVGMTVDCLRKGAQMMEVSVKMRHRETGRDVRGARHRGGQFVSVLKVLAKRFFAPWK